jgi:benzoyl-CoA-dihydrodiol lyase
VNGACAGGGYELALACDEILLVDDRSSAVSLPEVPLLGVLPGTGGLTRVTDKRHVRHDLADIFCTSVEGVRGQRAVEWRLVDAMAKPAQFAAAVQERALRTGRRQRPPAPAARAWPDARWSAPTAPTACATSTSTVEIDRSQAHRHLHRPGARRPQPADAPRSKPPAPTGGRCDGRELDDAILNLRTNELDIGTWLLKTEGDAAAVLAIATPCCSRTTRPLAGARDASACCAARFAPGRVVAQPVRADRAGFVLRRHAGRTGLRGRPQPTCSRCPTTPNARRRSR